MDLEVDDDEDGIADNDWVPPAREDTYRVAVVYEEAGRRTVRIEACDALNQCAMLDVDIDVAPESTLPPSSLNSHVRIGAPDEVDLSRCCPSWP